MSAQQPIRALTAIRGIAAWWVVLYHFREHFPSGTPLLFHNIADKGYLAVDLFFQLSGFVIALSYGSAFEKWNSRKNAEFYCLRLARIYPLHLFMMVIFIANPLAIGFFSSQGDIGERYNSSYYIMSLLLIQNWTFTDHLAWNIPAWSISTEWFCYIFFPALIFVYSKMIFSRLTIVFCLFVLFLVLTLPAIFKSTSLGDEIPKFGLFRCFVEFQIGIFMYYLRQQQKNAVCRHSNSMVLTAVALFSAYIIFPVPDYLFVPVGTFLLILSLTDETSVLARILALKPLEYIGTISYSTYLVHYFVKDWTKFLFVVAGISDQIPIIIYVSITAASSILLYKFVEQPGQQIVRSWTKEWFHKNASKAEKLTPL